MEAERLTKNLSYSNLNICRTKDDKKGVKSTRTRKTSRTYCFHFTQVTEKNPRNIPSKIGNFKH